MAEKYQGQPPLETVHKLLDELANLDKLCITWGHAIEEIEDQYGQKIRVAGVNLDLLFLNIVLVKYQGHAVALGGVYDDLPAFCAQYGVDPGSLQGDALKVIEGLTNMKSYLVNFYDACDRMDKQSDTTEQRDILRDQCSNVISRWLDQKPPCSIEEVQATLIDLLKQHARDVPLIDVQEVQEVPATKKRWTWKQIMDRTRFSKK
ncbi:uncharacterized protein TRUGW13939_00559 [Talaromyces rugulosus]|uniref:Uncharacterized protein n=1 Tax=Talaromyces rugulosus TaxID=121627 RepID=A0A7H8QHV2_TALRU|nr:uncharacterized protein TRUGW13939_00559 [Talaromyces rugulosus]QKX53480.1 hypothetical protein TRUGW13939_00559 [Talaromyces rugulosus]